MTTVQKVHKAISSTPAKARRSPSRVRSLSEEQLQAKVIERAVQRGWRVNHNYDSRKSGPDNGLPDLIMVRPPRLITAEIKNARRRVELAQSLWLEALGECGAETYVWRPKDWQDGTILRALL